MFKKLSAYLLLISLFAATGCSTAPPTSVDSDGATAAAYLQPPENNCEIRQWYNYQVVAIPVINQRWIEIGMSPEERAKRAYEIRHRARINARYMMPDKGEVQALESRDQQKYGNPDGPTFEQLLSRAQADGDSAEAAYREIIQSASRTNPGYNERCR
jgi:hypothetical protein